MKLPALQPASMLLAAVEPLHGALALRPPLFGRGGWCPSQDVTPWVIDATGEAAAGERNELTCRGLFHGADYVPEQADPANPGRYDATIRMSSYLVVWAKPEMEAGPVHPPAMRIPGRVYVPRSLRHPGD